LRISCGEFLYFLSPAGVPVLSIVRTHHATTTPVEAADIIVPGDRYEITWRTTVD
jgi:DNA-binding GntR family transcriptional regulator